ncbi:TonB-dependent receptor [Flavobacterium sp. LB1P62]|uniref:TonB-dependent receptor n=1 Tax=Flavobacterium sp. LB1P62 TaxID=3401715 RepID=UPI003AB0F112
MKKIIKKNVARPYFPKINLKMKLTTILLLVSLLKIQASTYSQNTKLTLNVKDASVGQIFNKIETISEFRFLYESDKIDLDRKITLNVEKKNISEVLQMLFKGTDVEYKTIDRQILLTKKKNALSTNTKAIVAIVKDEQALEVRGIVSDKNNVPLPGVNVFVKGNTAGTQTDFDGKYSIKVGDSNGVLVFSYIGFISQEISIKNRATLNVTLLEDVATLNEVVLIGYGTVKRKDLTGAVSSIKSEKIAEIPTNNALEILQGRISGMDMTKSDGQAGSGLSFTLRGNRSLSASNAPLILVDGIPYGSAEGINPSDIASIDVLKDASSTAIYGTRGANGVILITTKSGKAGKTKVSFNTYYGQQDNAGLANIQTGDQYIKFKREAFRTRGITNDAVIFNPAELEAINKKQYVDWMREIINTGSVKNYELNANGGNVKTTFSMSLGLYDEEGLFKNDNLRRYNLSVGGSHKISDNIKIGSKFFFTNQDNNRRYDPLNQANKINPFGDPYDDNGNIILYPVAGQSFNISPLVDEIPGGYVNNYTASRIFNSSYLEWKIIDNLRFKSSAGLDFQNSRRGYYYGSNTITRTGKDSQSGIENSSQKNYTWENILTYSKNLGNHDFDMLLGNSVISNKTETSEAYGFKQASETTTFYDLGSNTNLLTMNSDLIESSLSSYFGRVNYKFRGRYLLTASLRADGSSVLADGHKWGYFPSAALGWRISDESFMKKNTAVSNLMFRTSYGISGNSAISPYQTLGGLGKVTYSFGETAAFGYYPKDIQNPDLSWETTATTNFGLDFGLFENRISGTLNYYISKTSDLLLQRVLPQTSGFSSVFENIGKTENKGLEIELNTANIVNKTAGGFQWSSGFNFSQNKEKIVALSSGSDRDLGNGWIVGQPTQIYYDYQKVGIWQLGEETQAAQFGQIPGDIKVKDQNNDGKITATDDRVVVGTPRPDFNFGLSNEFSYKNFKLSVFLLGRKGQTIRNEASGNYKIDGRENGPVVDYWTPENPTNSHPRPDINKNQNSTYMSTLYYADGSFVKIKNITFDYTLKGSKIEKLKIENIRFYSSLLNYFTFSKLKPYDPERGGSISFPMTKQLIFGMNVNF